MARTQRLNVNLVSGNFVTMRFPIPFRILYLRVMQINTNHIYMHVKLTVLNIGIIVWLPIRRSYAGK